MGVKRLNGKNGRNAYRRLSALIGSDWELVNEGTILPISLADGHSVVGAFLPRSPAPLFALLTLFALLARVFGYFWLRGGVLGMVFVLCVVSECAGSFSIQIYTLLSRGKMNSRRNI